MAKILHLFRAPKPHAPMEELATARAVFEPYELMETLRPACNKKCRGGAGCCAGY